MSRLSTAALVLATVLMGCSHRVAIQSAPAGARIAYRGQPQGVAPSSFKVLWLPFRKMELEVSLIGYRTTTLNLQRDVGPIRLFGELLRPWKWDRWWGSEVRSRHEIHLVRVHGRAGTWSPEDAQR
jgi:hypothetical protein